MPDPATFAPLEVTGYTPRFEEAETFEVPEGYTFEHARFDMPNGYVVSLVRTDIQPGSLGYENGNWEAALTKPQTDILAVMLTGMPYAPASELDDLNTDTVDGFRLVANLDNAGIQALLDEVASRPEPSETTPEETDALIKRVLGDEFSLGTFTELEDE